MKKAQLAKSWAHSAPFSENWAHEKNGDQIRLFFFRQ